MIIVRSPLRITSGGGGTDNFTINHGSHIIKMGFEWYHLKPIPFLIAMYARR